jgi:hypothetical protein
MHTDTLAGQLPKFPERQPTCDGAQLFILPPGRAKSLTKIGNPKLQVICSDA